MKRDYDAIAVMSPERWKRLGEIFHAALQMSWQERSAFLDQVCVDDEELRREAESLLASDDAADDFLQSSAFSLGLKVLANREIRRRVMSLLSAGAVLDKRYKISGEIREGGQGTVYKARDLRLGWTVAIKVLKEDTLNNSWVVEKFRQEKDALAQIEHPNVVRLVDAGELENGAPYLVMKYVEGSDLKEILAAAKGGLEPSHVATIMRQAGHGVAALHEAGLVHRDIKPGNFMWADKDRKFPVKLIDLGIVRVLGTITRSDQIPGTPLYLSPEQLNGQDVTPASDVYALAVLGYELLAGQPLFDLKNVPPNEFALRLSQLQQDIVKVRPQDLLPAWPDAARVILQALAPDPNQRQQYDDNHKRQAAQVFGDDLAQALTPSTATTVIDEQKRVSPISRLANWMIFYKWRLIVAAIILVTVLAGVLLRSLSSKPLSPDKGNALPAEEVVNGRPESNKNTGTALPANKRFYETESSFPTGAPPSGMVYATIGFTFFTSAPTCSERQP
jgi:serine/threonine protein kinase